MADSFSVTSVEAAVGGPSTFTLVGDESRQWILASSSPLIQNALLTALMTGASVAPEVIGESRVILRIAAFEKGNGPTAGTSKFHVARIATQRTDAGDHLEVFIVRDGDNQQIAYNVYDPFVQQVLLASFQQMMSPVGEIPLHIDIADDKKIVNVRFGSLAGGAA